MTACATQSTQSGKPAAPMQYSGFLKDYYGKLQPGPEGGAKMRWVNPDADFSRYNRIMLDSVVFYLSDDSAHKGIDAQEMKALADKCNMILVNALKDAYPIAAKPGPDVLRIRFAITDLKQSNPELSTVTSVIPIGLGISIFKKGATGAWSGSGSTTAEIMVLDAVTNEVLAVAQDEKSAGFTERFSKWGSTEEAFRFWGDRIRIILDNVHGRTR
jgi:hypothetical protein